MNRLLNAIFLSAVLLTPFASYAGPECGYLLSAEVPAGPAATAQELGDAAPLTTTAVEALLTVPAEYGQLQAPLVDSELSSAEHPMIPLPSHALAAFILLGGVSIYVVRSQRVIRLR